MTLLIHKNVIKLLFNITILQLVAKQPSVTPKVHPITSTVLKLSNTVQRF